MPTVNLIGILTDIFPAQNVTPQFVKRVFWVKEPDTNQYPQHWEVEMHNEDIKRLQGFSAGDPVEAEVEVRGRQYTRNGSKSVFNSLKCTGLRKLTTTKPASPFKK